MRTLLRKVILCSSMLCVSLLGVLYPFCWSFGAYSLHFLFIYLSFRKEGSTKGQLNSEWIYEVIVSPQMTTKNYKDFCPTIQTRVVVLFWDFLVSVSSFFGYDHCLFGRAEILVILGLHFGRNDDLISEIN